jgi:hypothetical protein
LCPADRRRRAGHSVSLSVGGLGQCVNDSTARTGPVEASNESPRNRSRSPLPAADHLAAEIERDQSIPHRTTSEQRMNRQQLIRAVFIGLGMLILCV